jgi:hypothetical protein
MRKSRAWVLQVGMLTWSGFSTHAQSVPAIPQLLPEQEEVAIALSAAPEHLRSAASVYVLREHGFAMVRQGTNGFSCIVNRDHPLNQKPTCYDAEGSITILPKILRFGELLMQCVALDKIKSEIAEGLRTGKYLSPRRPGVAYMLSGDIKNYNASTGKVESFPPHIMFYAPNLTNEDIGSDGKFEPGLPSIGYQGPHGYMIVVMGEAAHPASHP